MRVGIDARLFSEPVTGIGRYTREVIKELINKPGQYQLYSPIPITDEDFYKNNVEIRSANFNSRVQKMLWSQTHMPYLASKDKVDLFWGTTHRLPHYLPNNIARVVTIHDLVWKHAGKTMRPLSLWMEKTMMPQAILQADRVVAVSRSTAKAIEDEYPSIKEKIRVVYPGTTDLPKPNDFQSLSCFGIKHPYFLFVGTLEPRKNLQLLLKAYASLDACTRSRANLVIAGGDGWGGTNYTQLIHQLGLNDQVIFTGYINDFHLSTLYANALFLAMPSLYEGFGLPIVEAMSFGVPVITSDRSSLPEVAGDAGVLVDPFNIISIANGLFSLLHDDTYRDKLASMALNNSKRFSWKFAADELWNIFNEAVEVRSRLVCDI